MNPGPIYIPSGLFQKRHFTKLLFLVLVFYNFISKSNSEIVSDESKKGSESKLNGKLVCRIFFGVIILYIRYIWNIWNAQHILLYSISLLHIANYFWQHTSCQLIIPFAITFLCHNCFSFGCFGGLVFENMYMCSLSKIVVSVG